MKSESDGNSRKNQLNLFPLAKKNKTEILSDDALVWTAVFIDWLDGVELFYWSFELIGLMEYLTIESLMRYLIKVGLIEYLTVETFYEIFDLILSDIISHGWKFYEIWPGSNFPRWQQYQTNLSVIKPSLWSKHRQTNIKSEKVKVNN